MKGFEPSTFAMARRRSSQLSYIRVFAANYTGPDPRAKSLGAGAPSETLRALPPASDRARPRRIRTAR